MLDLLQAFITSCGSEVTFPVTHSSYGLHVGAGYALWTDCTQWAYSQTALASYVASIWNHTSTYSLSATSLVRFGEQLTSKLNCTGHASRGNSFSNGRLCITSSGITLSALLLVSCCQLQFTSCGMKETIAYSVTVTRRLKP